MVRENIAATSLKMLWKNLYSVKCYDKLNMNVFTLSLWKNFWWGLIYFDQFSYQGCDTTMQERIFVILFFRSSFVLNLNYQVNIFASYRTSIGSDLNAMVEKNYPEY